MVATDIGLVVSLVDGCRFLEYKYHRKTGSDVDIFRVHYSRSWDRSRVRTSRLPVLNPEPAGDLAARDHGAPL
jgi:hypothetical protein